MVRQHHDGVDRERMAPPGSWNAARNSSILSVSSRNRRSVRFTVKK
jgi:hypothetical protein